MLVLQGIHSLLRWVVVIVAVVAIIKLAINLITRSDFDRLTRILTAAFGGLLDLQVLLGLVLLVWRGIVEGNLFMFSSPLARTRWEHLFVMLIAVVVAHLPARWKERPAALRNRNTLIALVISLALIVVGVMVLLGNRWVLRWPF